MHRLSILLLACLALAACAAPPVPRDHFYRVRVAPLTSDAVPIAFPGIVSIAPFEADGLLRERPILFSSAATQHEMQQHDYHYWNDSPTRMLQHSLAVYLQQSGLADTVVTPGMRIRPDFEVVGKVRRFERVVDDTDQRVIAEVELAVIRSDEAGLIMVKTYLVEHPTQDSSVEAAVDALGQAVAEIYGDFASDVAAIREDKDT